MKEVTSLVAEVARLFFIPGAYLESRPYGSGHINETYAAAFSYAGTRVRYIFQKVNERIFREPELVMENIQRVTAAALAQLEAEGVLDPTRRTLQLVPARDGRPFVRDSQNHLWRCYLFIENARTYDVVQSPSQAREAARAFGNFQKLAASIPGPPLHETLPDFHHTRNRFNRLLEVAGNDPLGRVRQVRKELDFIREREAMVDVVLDQISQGVLSWRVTHNDTKLNNVMLDDATGEGICVIDLDTVMPGSVLYDFGDLVRTATSTAAEDERDLTQIALQMPMFDALVQGYLSSAGDFLSEAEIEMLAFSGRLITLEIAIRFLTDYIEGDVYFKIRRQGHNLDRCRAQLALLRSMEEQETAMRQAVNAHRP